MMDVANKIVKTSLDASGLKVDAGGAPKASKQRERVVALADFNLGNYQLLLGGLVIRKVEIAVKRRDENEMLMAFS